jgi:transcriptional antiterminator RfaH
MNAANVDSLAAWRVVRAKPKCEHLAAKYLLLEGFPSYCPRLTYQKRTQRGPINFTEALFPGYLFAHFSKEQNRHVRSTQFVSTLLDFTTDLGCISDLTITDLQAYFPSETPYLVGAKVAAGDLVELAEGPLKGLPALVTKVLPGAERVRILVDFLGGQRETEVLLAQLLGFNNPREDIYTAAHPSVAS